MLTNAKIIRNNFLLENLSDNNPKRGAMNIKIILAIEFDNPKKRVRLASSTDTAKYSAKIIGKKPARTIVA